MRINPAISLSASALCILATFGPVAAAEICDLVLGKCPGELMGARIPVPANVVAVSPGIPFCDEKVTVKTSESPPISIVFIIDQSGSMNSTDGEAARYTVPSSLLDQINAYAPDAEVGLVLFSSMLEFDHRDNPYFKQAFPNDSRLLHDSFVPLTSLKKSFPGGKTGLDTLKAFLSVERVSNQGGQWLLRPRYATRMRSGGGTDITLGFKAAKAAMKASSAAKQNQYFIFLSDGEPSGDDAEAMEFLEGIETPTTFTVYFTGPDPLGRPAVVGDVPDVIVEMTDNIKANNYSASNPKSAYWGIDLPADQLKALLQEKVLGQILVVSAKPKSAELVSGAARFATGNSDAANFLFPKRIPLTGASTPFELTSVYGYQDASGGISNQKDTVVKTSFTVELSPGAILPAGMALACREQAALSLWHGGIPIPEVLPHQAKLEIRLTLSAGDTCAACPVAVLPSSTSDKESIATRAASGYSSAFFVRALSAIPVPGDGAFQHSATDSIVLVYRNPELPLDVVRRAFPFVPAHPTSISVRWLNPLPKPPGHAAMDGKNWILAGAADLAYKISSGRDGCCQMLPWPVTAYDSVRYSGVRVAATRAFEASVKIFSNLGQFVDEVSFSVPQGEFEKLPSAGIDGERAMAILWRSHSARGAPAGTGAYVFRTRITLVPEPLEPSMERTDTRVVGLLRVP